MNCKVGMTELCQYKQSYVRPKALQQYSTFAIAYLQSARMSLRSVLVKDFVVDMPCANATLHRFSFVGRFESQNGVEPDRRGVGFSFNSA